MSASSIDTLCDYMHNRMGQMMKRKYSFMTHELKMTITSKEKTHHTYSTGVYEDNKRYEKTAKANTVENP